MSSVSYRPYLSNLINKDDKCGICQSQFKKKGELKKEVVAHTGSGILHPIHKKCVKNWLSKHASCPTCRVPIKMSLQDRRSLPNRGWNILTSLTKTILKGVAYGLVLGTPCFLGADMLESMYSVPTGTFIKRETLLVAIPICLLAGKILSIICKEELNS